MNFNLDVNQIVNQIAEGLGVASSSLMKMYPQLVTEYSMYNLFGDLMSTFLFLTLTILVLGGFITIGAMDLWDDDKYIMKSFKWWIGLTVSSGLITIGMLALKLILAPNINLIMDIMERM